MSAVEIYFIASSVNPFFSQEFEILMTFSNINIICLFIINIGYIN
jgi:hypothetical protein